MKPENPYWTYREKCLIAKAREYPILLSKYYGNKSIEKNRIWHEVSNYIVCGVRASKKVLKNVLLRYAKLNNMWQRGEISATKLKQHSCWKYLDGTLDFMKPYIKNMSDDKIPHNIHRYYELLFNLPARVTTVTEVTLDQVRRMLKSKKDPKSICVDDLRYLMSKMSKSIQKILKEINILDSDVDVLDTEEEVNEIVIENGSVKRVKITKAPVQNAIRRETQHQVKKAQIGTNTDLCPDTLEDFLNRHNADSTQELDFVNYMGDLAEFLCQQLPQLKRKKLMNQIDCLVSTVLDP